MSLRNQVHLAVEARDMDAVETLIKKESRAVRYLVSMIYRQEADIRRIATRGIAIASLHHPKIVNQIVLRLIWSMTNESNTYMPDGPEVFSAIADENPEFLVPVTPDLIRLSADTSLKEGLCDTLRRIKERCPGQVGQGLTKTLNSRFKKGGSCGPGSNRQQIR